MLYVYLLCGLPYFYGMGNDSLSGTKKVQVISRTRRRLTGWNLRIKSSIEMIKYSDHGTKSGSSIL